MLRVYTDAIFQTTHSFMLASGGASMIDFDRTFILQMALFVFLIVVLAPTLFGPVLRLFEERERRTEGARTEARKMQEKAVEILARYEDELGRVQQVAAAEREKLRNETLRLEAKILDEARGATTAIVEEGRRMLEVESSRIRAELESRSRQISQEVAHSILGREVQP